MLNLSHKTYLTAFSTLFILKTIVSVFTDRVFLPIYYINHAHEYLCLSLCSLCLGTNQSTQRNQPVRVGDHMTITHTITGYQTQVAAVRGVHNLLSWLPMSLLDIFFVYITGHFLVVSLYFLCLVDKIQILGFKRYSIIQPKLFQNHSKVWTVNILWHLSLKLPILIQKSVTVSPRNQEYQLVLNSNHNY